MLSPSSFLILYLSLQGNVEFKGTFAEFDKNGKYYRHLPKNSDSEQLVTNGRDDTNDESDRLNDPSDSQKIENNVVKEPKETEELLAKRHAKRSVYLRFIRESDSKLMNFFLAFGFVVGICFTSAFDYWQVAW